MKIMKIILLNTLIASAVFAQDLTESQKFIGVEISITEVQGDGPSDIASNLSNGTTFGLRLGAQNEEWRTTIGLTYFDAEGRNIERLYGAIDYFFLPSNLTDSSVFKPFIGGNVGYQNYESNEVDEDGFVYGGQAGMLIDVSNSIDADISYRYTLSGEEAFDHSSDVVFGFNYQY